MHRDMGELELAPARSRRAQQHECDRWILDFDDVRPHDAPDDIGAGVAMLLSPENGWINQRIEASGGLHL